ncbi:MAG: type II toxin-antitoxin system VapC family toxin, partial [Acidimicrobiales bacterium]
HTGHRRDLVADRVTPRPGRRSQLLSVSSGELARVDLDDSDWERAVELVETYADLGLGLVDASVITVAERLRVTTIATLNHRDFTVVCPRHTAAFELLP